MVQSLVVTVPSVKGLVLGHILAMSAKRMVTHKFAGTGFAATTLISTKAGSGDIAAVSFNRQVISTSESHYLRQGYLMLSKCMVGQVRKSHYSRG